MGRRKKAGNTLKLNAVIYKNSWHKKPCRWVEGNTLFISVPFTWNLPEVRAEILQLDFTYKKVVVGGPAVSLVPAYLADIANVQTTCPGVLQRVNPLATRSTLGCPNRCGFCAVPRMHPEGLRELDDWPDLPMYCDDNLLAASRKYFDRVIDRLKKHSFADFNQGLDARRLKPYHAKRLAELRNPILRLAWDEIPTEKFVRRAISRLLKAGLPKRSIRVFVLIGFNDSPSAATYRFEALRELKIKANPMRYTPLDALERNGHVYTEGGWTGDLLKDYMKYWYNDRFFAKVPFEEFRRLRRKKEVAGQKALFA